MILSFCSRIDSVSVEPQESDENVDLTSLCPQRRSGMGSSKSCADVDAKPESVGDCRCDIKSVGDTENKFAAEVTAVDALSELFFAPPLLHGSLADHGSVPLEFIDVPTFTASSLFLVLRLSSSDALDES